MVFCLFISSSIALGPRVVALRPLEELIPGILAASKATSTVKGYNSIFSKVEGSEVLLQLLITIYQIVLSRSMAVGSPRRPKILTVGKIFNTSS